MKILFIFLLGVLPCLARIGETEAQCAAHYGKPENVILLSTLSGEKVKKCHYEKDGLLIGVTFYDGTACLVSFSKINGEKFTQAETADLLRVNSTDSGWSPNWTAPNEDRIWRSRSGNLASMDNENALFFVSSPASIHAREVEEQAKADKTVSGL